MDNVFKLKFLFVIFFIRSPEGKAVSIDADLNLENKVIILSPYFLYVISFIYFLTDLV